LKISSFNAFQGYLITNASAEAESQGLIIGYFLVSIDDCKFLCAFLSSSPLVIITSELAIEKVQSAARRAKKFKISRQPPMRRTAPTAERELLSAWRQPIVPLPSKKYIHSNIPLRFL
jgi:hypothetical protein